MVYETAISLGLVLSAFALIYLASHLKKFEHFPLQILFLIPAVFILLSHINVLIEIAGNESQSDIEAILVSVNTAYTWIVIFVVAYFLILFTTEAMSWISEKWGKKKKRSDLEL